MDEGAGRRSGGRRHQPSAQRSGAGACKPAYEPYVKVTEGDCAAGDDTVTVTTTTTNYKAVYIDGVWKKVQDGDPVVVETTGRSAPRSG